MTSLFADLRWRGLIHQATDPDTLARRLDSEHMVAYIGFDPTAGSLHVGHLQQLVLLERMQRAGHRAIALVGGGTGMIGDPSGKSEERNLLSREQLDANRAAIAQQIAAFLGLDRAGHVEAAYAEASDAEASDAEASDAGRGAAAGGGAVLADNADWLAPASLLDFLRDVGKHFSVNEMIRKDSVRARLEGREQSLSFTEFSYMLLQSWDFVQLFDRYGCDLQLGGSDQWGNITEGVDLIRRLRGATAYGLTSPLVTKADGTKFGKTESGSVWLDPERTSPYAFYQFWRRTGDGDTGSYLRRFTFLGHSEIEELERSLAEHPERQEAQRALARAVTTMVHGAVEADRAEAASAVLFTDRISTLDESTLAGALTDAPTTAVERSRLERGVPLIELLRLTGLASSNKEARTFVAQGSIYLNGNRLLEERDLHLADALHQRWVVLRRGRANQHVLVVTGP